MTQSAEHTTNGEAAPVTPALTLDFEQIKRTFTEQGYVVLRDVVSKDLLERLRRNVLEEFNRQKTTSGLFNGGGVISGHLNCFPGEESRMVYQALKDAGVIGMMRKLFPKAVGEPNVGMNLNLPKSVAQHYHSDSAFQKDFVILNIAVVDTDLVNGAIDLLPGTQKRFYEFWRYAVERQYKRTTRVPMKQGDIMIRTSVLWHRGMPNYSEIPRPMMALTWEDGGTKHSDSFGIYDGKIKFLPNWYRPNLLGRLRERTFVAAPITYSAWRFARSLYGNKGDAGF
jgi:hypothetical protein